MTPILTLWPDDGLKMAAIKVNAILKNIPGAPENFKELLCADLPADELKRKLTEMFQRLITLTAVDTTLHTVAILPLYSPEFEQELTKLMEGCAACENRLSLHLLALRKGIARVVDAQLPDDVDALEKRNIELLDKQASDGKFRYSYTILDDYAANGAAIDFSLQSFSEYLALIFNALMRSYHDVLPPSLLTGDAGRNLAFGAASIRFDIRSIGEYLLSRGFVSALENVGIQNPKVDASKAADLANTLLLGIQSVYPDFYKEQVHPLFKDSNLTDAQIVGRLDEPMSRTIDALKRRFTDFIADPAYSLPEKEATLALILGLDNKRLHGVQYDRETLLLDDACEMPIDLYVDTCNQLCTNEDFLPKRGNFPALKKYIFNFKTMELEEDKEANNQVFNPLYEIKRLKLAILNNTAFIRRKSEELERLLQTEEQRKRVDEKVTDKESPVLPTGALKADIKEQPLDDKYVPAAGLKPKDSVDLRPFFSPIRSQGELGSCSTFATVSMYEAIMNRFSGSKLASANLSEQFVYYYSNVLTGNPEGGSNFFEQLGVLGKHGVCQENLFGYTTENLDKEPSQQAIDDALNHRVLKALQIPLRTTGNAGEILKENHRLLTSALSEGYPVGIALKVYENFGKSSPYINRPDDNDRSSGGEGHHAMVLVGYSESEKCYIVRNSWGEKWGDKGYAYISAAYIEDPEYNSFACVITETTESADGKGAEVPPMVAGFAGSQTEINIAAIRNILDEARMLLAADQELYDENYRYYQRLIQRLGMPQVRNQIRKAAEQAALEQAAQLGANKEKEENEFAEKIRAFKKKYIITGLSISLSTTLVDTVAAINWTRAESFGEGFKEMLWLSIIALVMTVITVCYWAGYFWKVRKYDRELQDHIDDLAIRFRKAKLDFFEKQLQFHVAGMWFDKFHELSLALTNAYNRLESYNDNLSGWYAEDKKQLATPPRHEGPMFIYLSETDLIDRYFETNRQTIVRNIDLMATFDSYSVDRETIQDSRQRLRDTTLAAIEGLFADFRMVEFLQGRRYSYLKPVVLPETVGHLLSVGQPAVRHSSNGADIPVRLLFLDHTDAERPAWQQAADPCFPFRPTPISAPNRFTLDLITVQPLPLSSLR